MIPLQLKAISAPLRWHKVYKSGASIYRDIINFLFSLLIRFTWNCPTVSIAHRQLHWIVCLLRNLTGLAVSNDEYQFQWGDKAVAIGVIVERRLSFMTLYPMRNCFLIPHRTPLPRSTAPQYRRPAPQYRTALVYWLILNVLAEPYFTTEMVDSYMVLSLAISHNPFRPWTSTSGKFKNSFTDLTPPRTLH